MCIFTYFCSQEAPFEIPEADPPPTWPEYGVVKFDNYQVLLSRARFPNLIQLLEMNIVYLLQCKQYHDNLFMKRRAPTVGFPHTCEILRSHGESHLKLQLTK